MPALNYHPHPLTLIATCLIGVSYPLVSSFGVAASQKLHVNERFSIGWKQSSNRQKILFAIALASLFIADSWPVAEIAQRLLLGRLVQQFLIALCASPLLLLSIPKTSVVALTKPRYLDMVLTTLTRPLLATAIFTGAAVFSMTPAAILFEYTSFFNQFLAHLLLFVAASLIWIPILRILPGVRQLSTAGRIAFIFVQSLVPTVPALVLIFAKRSLYPTYAHGAFGISAVADQELTGAIAKVVSLAVFWSIAIVILLRANRDEELGLDPDPITWADVQRELDRTSKRLPPD